MHRGSLQVRVYFDASVFSTLAYIVRGIGLGVKVPVNGFSLTGRYTN